LLTYLAGKGLAHESKYLATLESSSKVVVTIESSLSNDEKVKATLDAMQNGADVTFQACLSSKVGNGKRYPNTDASEFRGYADFPFKINKLSKFGDYSYKPLDTKLYKQSKALVILVHSVSFAEGRWE
jgi:uncharacterized protein